MNKCLIILILFVSSNGYAQEKCKKKIVDTPSPTNAHKINSAQKASDSSRLVLDNHRIPIDRLKILDISNTKNKGLMIP